MRHPTPSRGKRQRIVAALDVGTSKICCLIARTAPAPEWMQKNGEALQFEVLGFGHHRAEGLKAGMIAHLDSAEHCIRSAVDCAERMAGVTVESLIVTVTCGRLASETYAASVSVAGQAIADVDIGRVLAEGRRHSISEGRAVVHSLPIGYSLDGEGGIEWQCGQRGSCHSASTWWFDTRRSDTCSRRAAK